MVCRDGWTSFVGLGLAATMAAASAPLPRCSGKDLYPGGWTQISDINAGRVAPVGPGVCASRNIARNCIVKHAISLSRVSESLTWEWKPTHCAVDPFDPSLLHRWFHSGHRLLFVGDSVNTDMADALKCMLNLTSEVIAVRLDRLGCKNGTYCGSHVEVQEQWSRLITSNHFQGRAPTENDIMVVNAGAHWYSGVESARRKFPIIAAAVRARWPGGVVFRTTVMGHVRCNEHSRPLIDLQSTENKYNWHLFGDLNRVIDAAFAAVRFPRYRLLNLSMYELRGDGHAETDTRPPSVYSNATLLATQRPDCLHYCVPGVPDQWNKFLFHIIRPYLTAALAA